MPASNHNARRSHLRSSRCPDSNAPRQAACNGLDWSLVRVGLVILVLVVAFVGANLASRYSTVVHQAALDQKLQKVIDLYGLRPLSIRRYGTDPKWKLGQA